MSSNEKDAGLVAYEQGDFAAALAEWRQLAEQGNLQACHNIAIMYEMGQGVEADLTQAQQWCERAAQGGSVPAQAHLGYLLIQQQQPEQAAQWWTKAAQTGDADAQFSLGQLYYLGQGVAKDDEEAADWFEAAALQNHMGAQFNLGVMYANGQRYAHAKYWWTKAAHSGDEQAQAALKQLADMGV